MMPIILIAVPRHPEWEDWRIFRFRAEGISLPAGFVKPKCFLGEFILGFLSGFSGECLK